MSGNVRFGVFFSGKMIAWDNGSCRCRGFFFWQPQGGEGTPQYLRGGGGEARQCKKLSHNSYKKKRGLFSLYFHKLLTSSPKDFCLICSLTLTPALSAKYFTFSHSASESFTDLGFRFSLSGRAGRPGV